MAVPLSNPNLTPQQLAEFQRLEKLLQKVNKNADIFADLLNKAGGNTTKITQELNAMEGYVDGLNTATKRFNTSLTESLDLAQGIVDALKKQEGAIKRATKAMSSIVSLGQQLVYEDQKLDALGERQLQKMAKEAKLRQEQLADQVETIAQTRNRAGILNKIVQKEAEFNSLEAKGLENLDKAERKRHQILENELDILKAYTDSLKPYQEIVREVEKRYKLEKEVTKTFGLTGVALSAASTIASKMSMGHISDQLEDINNKLRYEMREAIKLNSDKALGFGQRFMFAAKGAMLTGKAIGKGMLDPLYLMGKIYNAFLDVNKESVELSRLSGQNGDAMAGANFALADTVDVLKVAGELTKQMGLNAQNVFSPKVMAGAAELKNTMGLSAEEAGGLALMAQTGGKDIKDMSTSMVSVVSNFNKSNRSAVSQGVALREAAGASDSMKISLGNSGEALAKAAASATRLGLTLKDMESISDSLVDFQSSISNELEAELLTGKDLNLEKARELALSNDIAGVGNEIFKNSSDVAEYGKMNRIQQEAYAKALGLTKDQMAKVAYNKALDLKMSEEEAAKAAGVEASDMRRMAVQEKMAKVMDKIFQAFAPILDVIELIVDAIAPLLQIVGGIVGFVAKLLSNVYILYPAVLLLTAAFAGKAVASFFGTAIKGTRDLLASTKELLSGGIGQKLSKFGSSLGEAFSQAKSGGAGDMVKSKSGKLYSKDSPQGKMITNLSGKTDKAEDLANKVTGGGEEVAKPAKGGVRKGLQDLAAGLKSMGNKGVIQGIGNLALAGPAMVVAVASIPFLLTIAAIGIPAGAGLKGLASGLKALGKAGAGALEGIGILALFGVALIPFTYALSLLSPLIESFGKAIKSTFEGIGALIQSAAIGFATLMGALTIENIGPMLLLGPALFGIAAGLAAIAIAGPLAIPSLIAIAGVGAVVGGVASLFGAGESKSAGEAKGKSDEGSLAAVEKKLDSLILAVKAGGNVYMDSNKVGRAQVLGSYKLA